MKTKVSKRPKHPDGTKYHFNCCASPLVYEDEDGNMVCKLCGYDWTEEVSK